MGRIILSFILKKLTYGDLMLIRNDNLAVFTGLSALQGYVGGHVYNLIKGASLVNPLHIAVASSGITLAEKFFYMASSRVIPGPTIILGPIAVGPKNLVSFGLAIYTTLKVMHLAGLILSMPFALNMVGLVSGGALIVGGIIKAIQNSRKVTLEQHIASPTFANRLYKLSDDLSTYTLRIICNPEGKKIKFSLGGMGTLSSTSAYIIAYDEIMLPPGIEEQLKDLLQDSDCSYLQAPINGVKALAYTANPLVE